ncbi:MAG TPA: serine/threonine-protein kinase [Isosphaeraceae bacterium]
MLNLFKPKDATARLTRGGRIDLERRFILAERTSQGSMSKVYRALDRSTDQTVGLKVQIRDKCEAAAARSCDEKPGEGEIGMRIVHPHVARTLDWGYTYEGEQFIVMEYVDGVSLGYVRGAIKLGTRGKMKLLVQAAEGFAGIHAAGFIHHDVNPCNILINKKNQVKIIDFGLAVPNTPLFHKPGNRTGALPYMAPELIRRESTDEKLDVFAFGAVAFEFLTGQLPFWGGGDSMAMIRERINKDALDPAVANPKLSEDLCSLLRRALAKRKEDRPSMAELARRLAEVPPKREETT